MEVAAATNRSRGSRGIPMSLTASILSEDLNGRAGSDLIFLTPSPPSSPVLTANSGVVSSAEDGMEQQSGGINEFQTISKKRTRDDDVEAILLAAAAAGTPKGKCKEDLVKPPCVKTPRRELMLVDDNMEDSVLSAAVATDTPKAEDATDNRQDTATPLLRDIIQESANPTRLGDESAHDCISDQGTEYEGSLDEKEPPASPTFLSHEIYIIHENDSEDSCFMAPSPAKRVTTSSRTARWGHRRMSELIRRHVNSLEEFMERKSGGPTDFVAHLPPLEVHNECRSALVSAIQTLASCLSQLTDAILKITGAIHSHPLMGLVLSLETFSRDVEQLSKELFFPLVKAWIAAALASGNLCEKVTTLVEGDVTALKEESWALRGASALLKLANIARIYSSRGPPLVVRLLRKEVEGDANVLMEATKELCPEEEVYKVGVDLENDDAKELQRRFSMLRGHPAEIEAGLSKMIQLNKSIKPGDVVLRAVRASRGNLSTFQLHTAEGAPELSASWSLSVLSPTIIRISNALLAQTQPWTSPIIIEGPRGVGKSISVAAAIRRDDVRARFAGGVFWVRMRGKADLDVDVDWALEDLALKVTNHRIGLCEPRALIDAGTPWAPSLPTASRVLTQLSMEAARLSTAGYEALIVLDGLHDTQVLEALRPLGFHILAIMAVLPDRRHILPDTFDVLQIEALKIDEALSLISTVVSVTEQPPLLCSSAKSVASLCRGLPMALYMMAKCAGKREATAADEHMWSILEKEMQRDLKADDSSQAASRDPDRAVIRAATNCCLRCVSSDTVRSQYLSLSILPDSYSATGRMLRAVWGNCSVSTCSATCSELESLGLLHPVATALHHTCDSPWRHSLHFLYPIQTELIREEAAKYLDLTAKAAACQTFFLAEARVLREAQDIPMSHNYIFGGRRGLHMCWEEVEQGFSFTAAEAHAQMLDETRAIDKEGTTPNRSSAQGTFMITLGDFYFCRADYSLSLELYREGCSIASGTSQHAYALQGVARCFAAMGRIPEAMRRFRKGMSALDQDEGKNGGRNVTRWARDLVEMCTMISSCTTDTTAQDSLSLLATELRRGEMVASHCSTLLELIGEANNHPEAEPRRFKEAEAYWGQFIALWKDAFLAQPSHPRIGLALGTGRYYLPIM